ncbi:MAG: FecR family protein [Myxococcaceae bacterium]
MKNWRVLGLAMALWPAVSLASVGKIEIVDKATREQEGSAAEPLKAGSEIQLKDLIVVEKGNLKLTLNDASVIMLGEGSELFISEADFAGQERKGFSAKLVGGKIWSKVSKALSGSGAKFEVTTERAVAGVRGTIFRVDTNKIVQGVKPHSFRTVVRVTEGVVGVAAKVKAVAKGAVPAAKGERKQIAGPQEISVEKWEEKFVALQAGQQVTVGEELWKEAAYEPKAKSDPFAKFIAQHQ